MKKKFIISGLLMTFMVGLGTTYYYNRSNTKDVKAAVSSSLISSKIHEKALLAVSNINPNIEKQVKDYILNGQQNLPEAKKIKWSKTFLDKVDINELYSKYIASGGNGKDVRGFAEYITANAPIQSNWKDLFNEDLSSIYGEKAVKLVHLDGDFYQAYVNKDGKEVRFVVVSARTGYFHG
ncbi:hypothetical protein KYB31_06855 [Clostridium felsineum]|uniref:hypothetical protein n=1 Tax=Clostridium felsineum TaxID=36839 RepID=UPI00214D715D|nr:hypothetical protein [Clostridium felsineum]MCR3758714.1 hypothetical protein [Clostridium felsineum]